MINTLVVFREVLANDGISNVPVPKPRSEEKLTTRGQACDCAIELHRDRMWRRDEDLRIGSAVDAERFIEDVGFTNTLTDARPRRDSARFGFEPR